MGDTGISVTILLCLGIGSKGEEDDWVASSEGQFRAVLEGEALTGELPGWLTDSSCHEPLGYDTS